MTLDMTKGDPTRTIVKFTLPMLVGNLFQQLYNVVDTLVVGRYIGVDALAAVGSSFMLMKFFSFVIIGLSMGSSIVFAKYYGEKNYKDLRRSIFISFIYIGGFSLLLAFILMANTSNLLNLINTPEEILAYSKDYLLVIFFGLIFVFLYNIVTGVLRAIGDSRTPLYFLILAAILNIILDLVFVINFAMGVKGVAYATLIAQIVSSLGLFIYSYKKNDFIRMSKEDMTIDRSIRKRVFKYSFLTSIQQSIMTFGMLCVQGIVNGFGPDVIAAFTTAGKIDAIAYLPVQDFGNAFGTYVAQNKGAGEDERIKKGLRSVIVLIIIFCSIISLVILLNGESLMGIFLEDGGGSGNVVRIGVEYLNIMAFFYVLIGFLFMFYGYFRGMGALNMSLILTIVSLGTRVSLAYCLSKTQLGEKGIWWSVPIGWALADLLGIYFYKMINKNKG